MIECHFAVVAWICIVFRVGVGYAVVVGSIGLALFVMQKRLPVIMVVDKPILAMPVVPERRAASKMLILHDLRVQGHIGVSLQGMHVRDWRCRLSVQRGGEVPVVGAGTGGRIRGGLEVVEVDEAFDHAVRVLLRCSA